MAPRPPRGGARHSSQRHISLLSRSFGVSPVQPGARERRGRSVDNGETHHRTCRGAGLCVDGLHARRAGTIRQRHGNRDGYHRGSCAGRDCHGDQQGDGRDTSRGLGRRRDLPRARPQSGPLLDHDRASGIPEGCRRRSHRPARQDADRRCPAPAGCALGGRQRDGRRDEATRSGERNARAQRHVRGDRPTAERPELSKHRAGRSGRQRRRDRRRLPGQRRQQCRERVHDRRGRNQQLDLRELTTEHGVRVPAGGTGQDRRHRRRVWWRARRRHQRGHQVRWQPVHR